MQSTTIACILSACALPAALPAQGIPCVPGSPPASLPTPSVLLRHRVPLAWQADAIEWSRDQSPKNKVDDLIENLPGDPVRVIINHRKPITTVHRAYVAAYGTVTGEAKILPSIFATVYKQNLGILASHPDIAFIEGNHLLASMGDLDSAESGAAPSDDASDASLELPMEPGEETLQSLRIIASPAHAGRSLDTLAAPPSGDGMTICIMDTGVNDAHTTFAGAYVAGWDGAVGAAGNPPDVSPSNHGTHVASIALGRGIPGILARGVAWEADLVDVRVLGFPDARLDDASAGLEWVIDQHLSGARTVDVVNMSFGPTVQVPGFAPPGTRACSVSPPGAMPPWYVLVVSDSGIEHFPQLVSEAAELGISMVAAAGNCDAIDVATAAPPFPGTTGVGGAAASALAITVGAVNTNHGPTGLMPGTPAWDDDSIADFSAEGPRLDDGDLDEHDEIKPDLVAPGTFILGANGGAAGTRRLGGTSMAAPCVAGICALVREHVPGIRGPSVRALLLRSAAKAHLPVLPGSTPEGEWDSTYGWGFVDIYRALTDTNICPPGVDLRFEPEVTVPFYKSEAIRIEPDRPTAYERTTITATIVNESLIAAENARVHFSAREFGVDREFYEIGTVLTCLEPGENHVSLTWLPRNHDHQCVKVEIAWGCETDYSNPVVQRNVDVVEVPEVRFPGSSSAPAEMFEIRNDLFASSAMINVTPYCDRATTGGWRVLLNPPPPYFLDGQAPPLMVGVTVIAPPGATAGDRASIHLQASTGSIVLGGVSYDLRVGKELYVKASNTEPSDQFGQAIALSGDTMVIGAPLEDSSAVGIGGLQADNRAPAAGAVYVLRGGLSSNSWVQTDYIKASNTDSADNFGASVAISGDTMVIGAPNEDSDATGVNGSQTSNAASNSGAAYVFVRNNGIWTQQAYLKASNTGAGDLFGSVVAIFGDTIVVGAPREDSSGTGVNGSQTSNAASDAGAAYVFVRVGGSWQQQAYLKASNTDPGDRFGSSVDVFAGRIIVGAPREDSDAIGVNGSQTSNSAPNSGAAYLYVSSGTSWSQLAYLKASNAESEDRFGEAASVTARRIVVGAPQEDSSATGVDGDPTNNVSTNSGAVYTFLFDGSRVIAEAYLKASNTDPGDSFGSAVAAFGDLLVIGSPLEDGAATGRNGPQGDNNAVDAGAAYVYTALAAGPGSSGAKFSRVSYIKPTNTDSSDFFGSSVAISGESVVVGAYLEDGAGTGLGANASSNSASAAGATFAYCLDLDWRRIYGCAAFASELLPPAAPCRIGQSSRIALVESPVTGGVAALLLGFPGVTAEECATPLPTFLLNLSLPLLLVDQQAMVGNQATLTLAVPNDAALVGFDLMLQGLAFGPVTWNQSTTTGLSVRIRP